MQFGLLTYTYSTNIGDEIQTIAASRFLPRVDVLIERDRLHWYRESASTFAIFNGWFTHQPKWPPPESLHPLFVSFHVVMPELLLDEKYVGYFKRYEPIGCRSLATLDAFRKIGVDAYFSGCLTLTLDGGQQTRTDQVYIVDVDTDLCAKVVPEHVRKQAIYMSHEFPSPDSTAAIKARSQILRFALRGLGKLNQERYLFRSIRKRLSAIRHEVRIGVATQMLKRYSEAKLVITSRLHCAMPCLALGTPVLLLRPDVEADPRFEGLRELVRHHADSSKPVKIDWNNPEPNSEAYLTYARALKRRCEETVKQVSSLSGADDSLKRIYSEL